MKNNTLQSCADRVAPEKAYLKEIADGLLKLDIKEW